MNLSKTYQELERQKRLRKAIQHMPDLSAIFCITLTTIILAYGARLGPLSIVALYAMWLPRIWHRGNWLVWFNKESFFCLILSGFAILSSIWSDYHFVTLYSSLEYTSLVICTIILAKLVTTRAYIHGLLVGATLVLGASLASGNYGVDPFSGNYSLVGLFGSKNMVGFFAEIGIIASLMIYFGKSRLLTKLLYFPSFCIFLLTLYQSKSATSILSLAVTLFAMIGVYAITKLPRVYRLIGVSVGFFIFVMIIISIFSLGLQDAILKSFGKDSTLTGRTALWEAGIKAWLESPYLGHGFQGFWVQGNQVAEQLWYKFHIYHRGGFHFHNLYIETLVEIGLIGFLVMSILMILTWAKSLRLCIRHGLVTEHALLLAMSTMLFVRSFTEVDLVGTFSIGPVLFYSIYPKLLQLKQQETKASPPPGH